MPLAARHPFEPSDAALSSLPTMNNSGPRILVVSERAPLYDGGSGDQKLLYTTYLHMPNVEFCVINDLEHGTSALANPMHQLSPEDPLLQQGKQWRYEDLVHSFTMRQERFGRSEQHLSRIAATVRQIIRGRNIDIVVFEQTGILMWAWHKQFSDIAKCVLRVHDSHYHYLESEIRIRTNFTSRIALSGRRLTQRRYEARHIGQWHQVQFLSRMEFLDYSVDYPDLAGGFVHTPPSIVAATNVYLEEPHKPTDILFVGTMSWKPNTDAIRWFLARVLPYLKHRVPAIRVRIVGKHATERIRTRDQNVDVAGFQPSLESEYKTAKLVVNPSRSGGGVKVKLMEAAAFGLPVVSTGHGVSGFAPSIMDCLVVRDKPIEFAAAASELLMDESTRLELSRRLFQYSLEQFNIQANQKLWKAAVHRLV